MSGPTATPRVLVAPDSFKGTFAAAEVAELIARGLEAAGVHADRCPVADGGEGTVAAIVAAAGGRLVVAGAHDPLGRPIQASFALLGDGATAIVETASASGLGRLAPDERDPWAASTYGTGELIVAALRAGAREVLVGVGGSATVDGGAGALEALAAAPEMLAGARLTVLCDVRTTWERCAEVFGPQKGADAATVARLAARLDALAQTLPRDPRGVSSTGGAGGLSGALWAAHGAQLRDGARAVLDAVGFDERLRGAAAVVCGEGRLDAQTAHGKIVAAIGAAARALQVPVHAVVGRSEIDNRAREQLGLATVTEAGTAEALERAGQRLGEQLRGRR